MLNIELSSDCDFQHGRDDASVCLSVCLSVCAAG